MLEKFSRNAAVWLINIGLLVETDIDLYSYAIKNLFLIICCVYVVIYLAFYYFCPQRSRSPVNFHPLSIIQY